MLVSPCFMDKVWSWLRKFWDFCRDVAEDSVLFYIVPRHKVQQGFNVHGSVHPKNILIYIQQDATLHSLFYLETAVYISGGASTHHQKRIQLYLQHLVFVTPLLLPTAIAAAVTVWQIPDAVDTVVWFPDDGWWYHPKHVEQFPDKVNCVTLHLVGYTLAYPTRILNLGPFRLCELCPAGYLSTLVEDLYLIS